MAENPVARVAENPVVADSTTVNQRHGLHAVYAGLGALVVLNGLAIWAFHKDTANAVAVVGAISSPIVAMVSAYFGIKVGSQAGAATAATADAARTTADNQVKAVLGQLTPEQAEPVLRSLGLIPAAQGAGVPQQQAAGVGPNAQAGGAAGNAGP